MYVTKTTATVFQVPAKYGMNGQRFFTKWAAYMWNARQLVHKHCNCERGDETDGFAFDPCHFHSNDGDKQDSIRRRLALRFQRADKLERQVTDGE